MTREKFQELEPWEKEEIVMDAHIPEETKSSLLMVLRDERAAIQILTDHRLPDLRSCGLIVKTIEFTVDPISGHIREMMRQKGIPLPENDQDPDKCYLYFVGKHEPLLELLERAFERGDYEMIRQITTAEVPKNSFPN